LFLSGQFLRDEFNKILTKNLIANDCKKQKRGVIEDFPYFLYDIARFPRDSAIKAHLQAFSIKLKAGKY